MNYAKTILILALTIAAVGCVKGEKGDPGTSGKVISSLNCEGTISGQVGAAAALNGLDIRYNAVLTATGDLSATADIIDFDFGYSGTSFYGSGDSGAANGAVYVTADMHGTADAGFWKISLNRSTMVTSIVYSDASLGTVNMSFTSAACVIHNF